MGRVVCTITALLSSIMVHAADAAGTGEMESGFRCGTHLVSRMDQSFQVLQRCGQPRSRENISGVAGPVMEKWVYGPSGGYYTVLTFRDEVLIRIEQVRADE